MANLWYVGMILAVFASMAGTVGKQLIRLSEVQSRRQTKAALYGAKISMVVALALMTVIGPLIDMASYAFAPQSLIAPLGALDVVWNTLLAPFTLGESLNRWLILGCLLIAAGAVATSLVGTHEDASYSADEMKDIFIRWQVLAYLVIFSAFNCFSILVPMRLSAGPKDEKFVAGNKVRGLALGLTAGSIAGNMFCVKAFVELVQGSIKSNDVEVWSHWIPYVMLVGAIIFALSNLYFLTKGMKEYEALFMGSIFEGSLIFFACLSGGIVFKEFEVLKAYEFALYCAALFGIVGGIVAVAKGASHESGRTDVVITSKVLEACSSSSEGPQRQSSSKSDISGISVASSTHSTPSCRSPFRQCLPETLRDVQERAKSTAVTTPHGGSPATPLGKQSPPQ